MDVKVLGNVQLEQYIRFNGIANTSQCTLNKNLSILITHGILYVFLDKKLVEAVYLLHRENVKIAIKNRILAVAYINQGFLTRFLVKFQTISDLKNVIGIINSYNPVIRKDDHRSPKQDEKMKTELRNIANGVRYESDDKGFVEVGLDDLKALSECGDTDQMKADLAILTLDPKFLQYVAMMHWSLEKQQQLA